MSDESKKPAKTLDELHKEYGNLCMQAGHIQYQIDILKKDLEVLNQTRKDINFEAAALKAKADEEAKAADAPKEA